MQNEHDLAKWLGGEMTPEELQAFEKSPEFQSYQKIAAFSEKLQTSDFESDAMLENIISHKKATPKTIHLYKKWLYSAAAILIVALGFLFFQANEVAVELAENGKKQTFLLPDHSEIVLNSGSKIEYKKWRWDHNRTLELAGEAFFKVAKGKKFDVNTNLGKVTVVGTQFNVRVRNNRFEVECFEGKVLVKSANNEILLQKGEMVIFEDGQMNPYKVSGETQPNWVNNEIRVISEPLNDILSEMERLYDIEFENPKVIATQKFTGFLPADNLGTALRILAKTYQFDYKISGNQVEITAKNN